ncbi:MAG: type IA DNA topoisomerase [Lachnospiraceae bacterium]|nr:type IA DNA topoisomerase [Lachnospiraceae bacterium]
MGKSLFIAEKPSVATEFAKALKVNSGKKDGYIESEQYIVTWCVGHLVTMSYPEVYDENLKRWSLDTIPFIPTEYKYEVIPAVAKQFGIVKGLLTRPDVETIYVCTDSGREGEYIYRLVEQMAGVKGKIRKRVWIDSQTEEEILRGIKEAKDLSEYDNLSSAAYLRAKEDYLMGINFSRVLTLKYGRTVSNYLRLDKNSVISVGRVMTCVLGMIVRREREIREFVKTPFYRVVADVSFAEGYSGKEIEWKAVEGSKYFETPYLYKENGFKERETAEQLINDIGNVSGGKLTITDIQKKKELKNPPLLFNLAELQNECSRIFKISPDETLRITQELYEKKLVTYPRTDARVLSTAVAKEIYKNISGLKAIGSVAEFVNEIMESGSYKKIASTKYVNDKQITDHYAIIPTGQGFSALGSMPEVARGVYGLIVRRFLSIFYPAAQYQKISVTATATFDDELIQPSGITRNESFFGGMKVLMDEGYLKVANSYRSKDDKKADDKPESAEGMEDESSDMEFAAILGKLKKGDIISYNELSVKEGETSPPKRYNSGSLILAMENAGQLIEDEDLRAQIKGSGIGTSATRAEIIKKLINNKYIALNQKTQIVTPTQVGEMINDIVYCSIGSLLNPELTASWEKGLKQVSDGEITEEQYLEKLDGFVTRRVNAVKDIKNEYQMRYFYDKSAVYYK